MNLRPGKTNGQGPKKPQVRSQQSTDFIAWVNKLGIERTWMGKFAHYLDSQFYLRKIGMLFLFTLGVSFLITWDFKSDYRGYLEGDLVTSDIKSPITFEVTDHDQAYQKRLDAQQSIPPVYDFDVDLYKQITSRVRYTFLSVQAELKRNNLSLKDLKQGSPEFLSKKADFERDLGGNPLQNSTFRWLIQKKFGRRIEAAVVQNLDRWSGYKIVDDLGTFKQGAYNDRIIINILNNTYDKSEFVIDTASLVDVEEIKDRVMQAGRFGPFQSKRDLAAIADIITSQIVPNLTLNKQETESRRQAARETVVAPVIQIKKGQVIVRKGSPIQKIHVAAFEELNRITARKHQDFVALVMGVFLLILILSYWSFLSRFTSKVKMTTKDALAMGTILIVVLVMCKFVLFVANTALVEVFTEIPPSFYAYLVPVSAGSMLVGLLIPFGEVVWLFAVLLSVVSGLLLDRNFSYMIITFTSAIVAARGVFGCKTRGDLYLAGLKTGGVNAALIFCATLIEQSHSNTLIKQLTWNTPAGLISGIIAALVALTLIPLLENIFAYTTDVKLLELSNLNHPLLKELIVKAPGTYHHSLIVGSMCEAAAESIGANPLLAKVCAYYHDIGKTGYAQYFIENQRTGDNPHNHINPSMSRTILIAHVKDGAELALKYKLGKPILDVILQHHGTTVISFFYHKAKESENTETDEISEDDYRYPGPKPQFREAALCMLADCIEAAARSLDEPTSARLQGIVRNIVQRKFLDGQLDECNLTLKDLSSIEEAFSKILLGIFHHRIDYPTGADAKS